MARAGIFRNETERKGDELIWLMFGMLNRSGRTNAEIAKSLCIAPSTLCRRLKKPEEFTLKEIRALCRAVGMTEAEKAKLI